MKGVDKAAPGAVQRTKLAYVSNAQLKPEELTELVGKIAVGAVDNLQVARACAPQPSSPAFQITACPPRLRFRMQVARAQQMAADRERVIHDEGFNTARAGDANDEPQRHRLLILTLPLRLAGAVADAAGGEEGAAGETGGRAGSGGGGSVGAAAARQWRGGSSRGADAIAASGPPSAARRLLHGARRGGGRGRALARARRRGGSSR